MEANGQWKICSGLALQVRRGFSRRLRGVLAKVHSWCHLWAARSFLALGHVLPEVIQFCAGYVRFGSICYQERWSLDKIGGWISGLAFGFSNVKPSKTVYFVVYLAHFPLFPMGWLNYVWCNMLAIANLWKNLWINIFCTCGKLLCHEGVPR